MSIEHIWNGTVLTVISDRGVSSADLQGQKGDTGPRGPQGPAGVILNEQGEVVVDLAPYYTGAEVDNKIAAAIEGADLENYPTNSEMATYVSSALGSYATKEDVENVEVDLTGYATETYVKTEVAKAQLEGAGVDTSVFATKDDLDDYRVTVDDVSIKIDTNGALSTAIGGGVGGYLYYFTPNCLINDRPSFSVPLEANITYCFEFKFSDGVVDTIVGHFPENPNAQKYNLFSFRVDTRDVTYMAGELNEQGGTGAIIGDTEASTTLYRRIILGYDNTKLPDYPLYIEEVCISLGNKPTGGYSLINAKFIPVDGVTTKIENGKLVALAGGEVNLTNYYTKSEVNALVNTGGSTTTNNITYGKADITAGSSYLATGTLYVVYE